MRLTLMSLCTEEFMIDSKCIIDHWSVVWFISDPFMCKIRVLYKKNPLVQVSVNNIV